MDTQVNIDYEDLEWLFDVLEGSLSEEAEMLYDNWSDEAKADHDYCVEHLYSLREKYEPDTIHM